MQGPVLIVIDMLTDYLEAWSPELRTPLIRSTNQLLATFRDAGLPIVWVRQEFEPDLSDAFPEMKARRIHICIKGTPGAAIWPDLQQAASDHTIVKKRYSAFFGTALDALLAELNPDAIVLAGINTHACIRTTAIDAYQRDWPVRPRIGLHRLLRPRTPRGLTEVHARQNRPRTLQRTDRRRPLPPELTARARVPHSSQLHPDEWADPNASPVPSLSPCVKSSLMPTRVRSYSKINLGLAIGPPRPDGFHGLATLYQTLALHDIVTVTARPAAISEPAITLTTNHPGSPPTPATPPGRSSSSPSTASASPPRSTSTSRRSSPFREAWAPAPPTPPPRSGPRARAHPISGPRLALTLSQPGLGIAAQVGSDVPLFLIGGAVLGTAAARSSRPMPDLPATPCVIAIPAVGVSTPRAFREWDAPRAARRPADTDPREPDRLEKLSRVYASVMRQA